MRVIRSAGENVSPSDDGRLYDQIFTDGLFNDTTFVNLGGNNIQCGSMYGDLCGRDFTIEQMVIAATLPEGEGETSGFIYVEIDTASDDVITLNTALAPFTPTYEDINTNGAIVQMIVAEYTATAVAVQSVTPVYKIVSAGSVLPGSVATVEVSPATQNHAVGEFILYDGQLYSVTSAITAGQSLTPGTNISSTSAGDELSSLKSGLTWKRILDVVTTANVLYDQTITVENIANYNEIMLTIQRNSNGRTFATSACPVNQFQNAGLYAGGSYFLYSGQMQSNGNRWINAVAIWQATTRIEIAVNANDEAVKVRVFVR